MSWAEQLSFFFGEIRDVDEKRLGVLAFGF